MICKNATLPMKDGRADAGHEPGEALLAGRKDITEVTIDDGDKFLGISEELMERAFCSCFPNCCVD